MRGARACAFCCEALRARNQIVYEVGAQWQRNSACYWHFELVARRMLTLLCVVATVGLLQDAKVIAMLDHNPRAKKHVLVIPHEHIPSVDDLSPAHYDLRT